MLNLSVGLSENIGALKTRLIGHLIVLLRKLLAAFVLSIVLRTFFFYDALLLMLKGREQSYKHSLRQKMKRTAIDNNYMIQVLSCCFITNTLDSSNPLCKA